ncbi:MAG: exodeoxyribonuclease VII large subunit, partial [Candidatus Riflebacteria bacterium]|nr:exodeoxyribonuclease VII large subunit [Candidatus Riflebacteria bacterium]
GEIVVPVKNELKEFIARQQKRLAKALRNILSYQKQSLRRLAECRFLVKPSLIVAEKHVKVMNVAKELDSAFQIYIQSKRHRFELLKSNLNALDPNSLLKRGYVLVTSKDGSVLNSVDKLSESQKLDLHFVDGIAQVTVGKIAKGEK